MKENKLKEGRNANIQKNFRMEHLLRDNNMKWNWLLELCTQIRSLEGKSDDLTSTYNQNEPS